MCKDWFKPKPPVVPLKPIKLRSLSFTINDYPGSMNDLNGCNNDARQVKETFLNYWNDFDVQTYMDSEAKLSTFKSKVTESISLLDPGAIVLVLADSCFSGTITKMIEPKFKNGIISNYHPTKNRFYKQPDVAIILKPKEGIFAGRGDLRWIVISGCGETQYSADAYINNDYHGAFTWYAMNILKPGITYKEWHTEIRKYLPGTQFEQAPTIDGPDWMLDTKVFSTQTLVIHNSTHGTQLNGIYGDEPIDEAICFYDGNLRDNDYYNLLINIK